MMKTFTPYKRWINQHAEKIKEEYADRPTEEMAQEMDVNYYTVSRHAARLGVSKSAAFMHASWKKGSKKGRKRIKSTESSDAYLQEHFANTSNGELAKRFGVDVKTVRRWARRLGLVKSENFMRMARQKGAAGRRQSFYTQEYIIYRNSRIAEVYPGGNDEDIRRLCEELGVSRSHIKDLAGRIGVKRRRDEKYPPQFLAELKEYFYTHTDKECAAQFGISKPAVQGLARKYGWYKAESHVAEVHLCNVSNAQKHNIKNNRELCQE